MLVPELLLFAVVAFAVANLSSRGRPSLSLDGKWECAFGDPDATPAADAYWQPVTVPSTTEWTEDGPHCLWYRRRFQAPSEWTGSRIILKLGGVKFGQVVRVNGNEVGRYTGGFEPTEYDLTDSVTLGQDNELMVAARDFTCLIAPDAEVGKREPGQFFGTWVDEGILYGIGSSGPKLGIWDSVSVEARSDVWIDDVFVITSVRERRLTIQVTVKNGGPAEARTAVSARVTSGGPGPDMAPQETTVGPGEEKLLTFDAPWSDARLWCPQDPHLYHLSVAVQTDQSSDLQEIRFGFREFWVEGDRFILNGTPMNLLATSLHSFSPHPDDPAAAYEIARQANCTAVRLHTEPWRQKWYDVADEIGMPLVWESAYYGLSTKYGGAAGRDEYWDNMRVHMSAQMKLHRNQPSILIWSAENELLLCETKLVKESEARLGEIADLMHELDPTRPIMFEGDEDPVGNADIVNLHYPHELPKWNLYPETAHWFDAPVVTDMYPNREWVWDRSKPLYLGEILWVPPININAGSVFFGDAAYPVTQDCCRRAKTTAWEIQIIAARDAGVNGICPWVLFEGKKTPEANMQAHQRGYQPIAAFPKETGVHAFAGTATDRTIMVFNDTPQERSLELRWRLAAQSGAAETQGSTRLSLPPAGRTRVTAAVAAPSIDQPVAPARFTLELWEGGTKHFSESRDWKLYDRARLLAPIPGGPARVAVYDPSGETSHLLSELGIESLLLTPGNARRVLQFAPMAVVGKNALGTKTSRALWNRLMQFARDGGTVVVFEQEQYPESLIPLSLTAHDSTIAFPRSLGHPVLEGVDTDDLAHWLPDGIVGRKEIRKPPSVGFTPIVDSGGEEGLTAAGLAQLCLGRGRLLLCQLDVTSKFSLSPIAARLVRNLLACSSRPASVSGATGAICCDATASLLDKLGLRYRRLSSPLTSAQLRRLDILIISDMDQIEESRSALIQFVRSGGRVLLHNVTPGSASLVQDLLGVQFELSADCDGIISLTDRGELTSGISNFELAWYGGKGEGEVSAPLVRADIADHPLTVPEQTGETVEAMTAHTQPCLLASKPSGVGLWVVDQVRWDREEDGEQKALRYAAMLLTNLGCQFDEAAHREPSS